MRYDRSIETVLIATLREPQGTRSDCQRLIETFVAATGSLYGFIGIENSESGEIEIVAASGLDAIAFRRLETRASRSALARILDNGESIDLLLNDEPSLDFLAIPKLVPELRSMPVIIDGATIGFVSAAIDKQEREKRNVIGRLLEPTATLVTLAIRFDKLRRERFDRIENEIVTAIDEMHERFGLDNLIGNSSQMRQAIGQIRQVSRSNANVLIRGDVGTGKAAVASTIHFNSLRSKRPFVEFRVSMIPPERLSASLFGSENSDGSVTPGSMDDADGGSIYIDEIAAFDRMTQAELLRLLTTRSYRRVGSETETPANVRIIAASRQALDEMVTAGDFSRRLFERLGMFSIFLPPLRDRKSDVLMLAEHFIERYSAVHGKRIKRISTPAIDMLAAYHFPGNVRELENAIERAVIACDSNVIHGRHLPPTLQTAEATLTETQLPLGDAVDAFERDLIQDALKSTRGNIAKAARQLSTTERILAYKIKNLGIDTIRFRT